jgi:hypothetical protein
MKSNAVVWSVLAVGLLGMIAPSVVQAKAPRNYRESFLYANGQCGGSVTDPDTGDYEYQDIAIYIADGEAVYPDDQGYVYKAATCWWNSARYNAQGEFLSSVWGYAELADISVANNLSGATARGPILLYESYWNGEEWVVEEYEAQIEVHIVGEGQSFKSTSHSNYEDSDVKSVSSYSTTTRFGRFDLVALDGTPTGCVGGYVQLINSKSNTHLK